MHCPNCKSKSRNRLRRKLLQRLLPTSKRYQCTDCKKVYLGVTLFKEKYIMF